jgi:hypothetical protein
MKQELIELTLPEWGFISDAGTPDPWEGRDVLLHVRSMTVFEFVKEADTVFNPGVTKCKFWHNNIVTGEREEWVCAVHIVTVLKDDDSGMLDDIMRRAVKFFDRWLTDTERETLNDYDNERLGFNN